MTTIRVYDFDETLAYCPTGIYRLYFGEWGPGGFVPYEPIEADREYRRRGLKPGRKTSLSAPGDVPGSVDERRVSRAFEYSFDEYRQARGTLDRGVRWGFPGPRECFEWLPAADDLVRALDRGDVVAVVSSREPEQAQHLWRALQAFTDHRFPVQKRDVQCIGTPDKGPAVAGIVRWFLRGNPDQPVRLVFHDDNPRAIDSVRRHVGWLGVDCECIKYSRTNTGQIEPQTGEGGQWAH